MGKNALCIILASPTSESAENKFVIVVFLKYQGTIQVDCAYKIVPQKTLG